jgi:DNA-nicking Smr family endonuclease
MTKRSFLKPEDSELFRASVGELRRLQDGQAESRRQKPPPIPKSRIADERQVMRDSLSPDYHPADFETGEEISYARPGLDAGTVRKLRRGRFSVGAVLDLHGMTAAGARDALDDFIDQAQQARTSCVRIIHGKGLRSGNQGPVLKQQVNRWLRQKDEILAFCSARPSDGGTGAIYVLIKRPRQR